MAMIYHAPDEGDLGAEETGEELAALGEMTERQTQLASYFELRARPRDMQPARVYIESLSLGSQRTQREALLNIVRVIIPEAPAEDSEEGEGPKEKKRRRRSRDQMRAEREMREEIIYTFPWEQLRYQHTAVIRAKLDARYKYATANRFLSALRSVLHHAWLLKLMSVDDYLRAKEVKNIRGHSLPKGRALQPGEIDDLINACLDDEQIQGCRDLAIILLLFSTGIRRAECAALNVEDYDPLTRALKIQGKGNKERTVFVESVAGYTALDAWIERRGSTHGPLFCPIEKGEHFGRAQKSDAAKGVKGGGEVEEWLLRPLARLSEEGIYYILKKRAREAGIADLSPHDFRRNMIGVLFDNDIDVATMRRITGHSNIETLVGYDRRPEGAMKKAAGVMTAPVATWRPRGRKKNSEDFE